MFLSLAIIAEWFRLDYPKELNEIPTPTIEKMALYIAGIQVLDNTVYIQESTDCSVVLTNRDDSIEITGLSLREVVNSLEQCFNHYNHWLTPIHADYPLLSQETILTAFSSVFVGPIIVVNSLTSGFSLIGDSAPFKQIDFLNRSLAAGIFDEAGYIAFTGITPYKFCGCYVYDETAVPLLVSVIHHAGRSLGLILSCPASLSPGAIALFNEFCHLEYTWMMIKDDQQAVGWGEQVFLNILHGRITDYNTIARYFTKMGLDVSIGYVLIYYDIPAGVEIPPYLINSKHISEKHAHVWQDPWNKRGYIIIRSIEQLASRAWLYTACDYAKKLNIHIGMGAYDTNYLHVAKQFQWARAACRPVTDDSASANIYESSFLSSLADLLKGDKLAALPSMLILRHYDSVHNSRHLDVLRTYFQCNLSKSLTAERLGIHRNTVQKHLDRIKEITDLDIEKQEFRLAIELYLYLVDHGYLPQDETSLPPMDLI